jgi:hypothetical protein
VYEKKNRGVGWDRKTGNSKMLEGKKLGWLLREALWFTQQSGLV